VRGADIEGDRSADDLGHSGRQHSLDGLRGVAALVVLLHHSLLLMPALAKPYYTGMAGDERIGSWLMLYTPLHLFWAGTEAVFLFFIISGVALTFAVRGPRFSWPAYFPSRMLRLYGPVVAAVLLAAVTMIIVPRTGQVDGQWLAAHARTYPLSAMVKDSVLLGGVTNTVSPLWSLQWEVLFSLLLPVALVIVAARLTWVSVAAAILLSTAGYLLALAPLKYLAMFLIGVALGKGWARFEAGAARISASRWGTIVWLAVAAAGVLLTCSYWLVLPIASGDTVVTATRPAILLGATLILLAVSFWRPLRALFSTIAFQWLGRISFSLYLVHEPIVVALGYLFHESRWAIPVAVVVSLVVAYLFYELVEKRLHRFARRVQTSARVDRALHPQSASARVSTPPAE
jgi:peptidoglycan/LPS O-acetylase OafA/YrhL